MKKSTCILSLTLAASLAFTVCQSGTRGAGVDSVSGGGPGANVTNKAEIEAFQPALEQREGAGTQVRFGDRMVDADGLSEETAAWLDWYNSLPEEQQLAVNAVPPDLLEEDGLVKTEDAEVSAQ